MPINIAIYPEKLIQQCSRLAELKCIDTLNMVPIKHLKQLVDGQNQFEVFITNICELCCEKPASNPSLLIIFPLDRNKWTEKMLLSMAIFRECTSNLQKTLLQDILYVVAQSSTLQFLNIVPENLSVRVKKMVSMLEKDPFTPIGKISKEIGISRGHLSKIVKNELDLPFITFRMWFRVARAIKLILEGNLTIPEIAYRLNYATPAHFWRDFMKTIKIRPAEAIRNKNKYDIKALLLNKFFQAKYRYRHKNN